VRTTKENPDALDAVQAAWHQNDAVSFEDRHRMRAVRPSRAISN